MAAHTYGMGADPGQHEQAARHDEEAARHHDRSATFWDGHGKRERAGLQRELADYERRGAELERRWAKLVDVGAEGLTDGSTQAAQWRELAVKLDAWPAPRSRAR